MSIAKEIGRGCDSRVYYLDQQLLNRNVYKIYKNLTYDQLTIYRDVLRFAQKKISKPEKNLTKQLENLRDILTDVLVKPNQTSILTVNVCVSQIDKIGDGGRGKIIAISPFIIGEQFCKKLILEVNTNTSLRVGEEKYMKIKKILENINDEISGSNFQFDPMNVKLSLSVDDNSIIVNVTFTDLLSNIKKYLGN